MNLNILTETEEALLEGLIDGSERIVVCCHKSPDGDALGSSLAWAGYLSYRGKAANVVVPDAFPDFLRWLPGVETVTRYDKHKAVVDEWLAAADLIFCLDFNESARTQEMQASLDASPGKKVMIDHHPNPLMACALTISRPEMSSTAELIFRILWQTGHYETMTKKGAATIFCGMMTDTGGFTYNSNSPALYFIISKLLEKGVDKDRIYRKVYNNYSAWAIRMRGYMMCMRLTVMPGGRACYFSLTRKIMSDFHFVRGDAEGLVNEPLRIRGMRLSISLREDDRYDDTIWVSLRSVDDFPCNKMAGEYFNGGGHLNASGGCLRCDIRRAEAIVRAAIEAYKPLLG